MAGFGEMLANGLIGTASAIGTSTYNNLMNRKQADYEYSLNEQAADSAYAREKKAYNELYSPAAQMQQLKEAGLSPSLYYNGSAGGSVGGSQQGGASVASSAMQNPFAGFNIMDYMERKEDIKSKRLDNQKKEKTFDLDIENVVLQNEKLKSDIKNTDIQTKIGELNASYQELQNKIAEGTWEDQIKQFKTITDQQAEILSKLKRENEIGEQTKANTIIQFQNQTWQTFLSLIEGQVSIDKNRQEVENLKAAYTKLCIEGRNLITEGKLTEKQIQKADQELQKGELDIEEQKLDIAHKEGDSKTLAIKGLNDCQERITGTLQKIGISDRIANDLFGILKFGAGILGDFAAGGLRK